MSTSKKVSLIEILDQMSEEELSDAMEHTLSDPIEDGASPSDRSRMCFELLEAFTAACKPKIDLPDIRKEENLALVEAACEQQGHLMRDTVLDVIETRGASLGTLLRTRLLLDAIKASVEEAMALRLKNDMIMALLTRGEGA